MSTERRYRKNRKRGNYPTGGASIAKLVVDREGFDIVTFDNQHWIHPYTGHLIPLGTDSWQDVATEVLTREGHKQTREPLSLLQLLTIRWEIWLKSELPHYQGACARNSRGQWINPITDQPSTTVTIIDGVINTAVRQAMAEELARIPNSEPQQFRTTNRYRRKDNKDRKATQVQENFLRPLPRLQGWQWGRLFEPLEEVGGDFIEVIALNEQGVLIAVGDVSGHGTQGALISVAACKSLRHLAPLHSNLADLATALNEDLRRDLVPGQFVTCWLGYLDPTQGRLDHVSLGHEAPIILDHSRNTLAQRLPSKGSAIGILDGPRFTNQLDIGRTTILNDQCLLIFTDGLSEMGEGGPRGDFGFIRIAATALANSLNDPEEMISAIAQVAHDHATNIIADDVSMLALKRLA